MIYSSQNLWRIHFKYNDYNKMHKYLRCVRVLNTHVAPQFSLIIYVRSLRGFDLICLKTLNTQPRTKPSRLSTYRRISLILITRHLLLSSSMFSFLSYAITICWIYCIHDLFRPSPFASAFLTARELSQDLDYLPILRISSVYVCISTCIAKQNKHNPILSLSL